MPEGADKRVLHRVFGVVPIGQQMRGDSQAAPMVPVDEGSEPFHVTGQHPSHYLRISQRHAQ